MTPLIELAIEHGATNPPREGFSYHGESHWKGVALVGLEIARKTPGVDIEILLAFAMLHDIMRENEDDDPEHGARAGRLFLRLVNADLLEYFRPTDGVRTATLYNALVGHCCEPVSADPTVGACWDADRLTLWRVGIEPRDEFLSTHAAKLSSTRVLGWELARRQIAQEPFPAWEEINKEMQTWKL